MRGLFERLLLPSERVTVRQLLEPRVVTVFVTAVSPHMETESPLVLGMMLRKSGSRQVEIGKGGRLLLLLHPGAAACRAAVDPQGSSEGVGRVDGWEPSFRIRRSGRSCLHRCVTTAHIDLTVLLLCW